jgi:hypothetical protein
VGGTPLDVGVLVVRIQPGYQFEALDGLLVPAVVDIEVTLIVTGIGKFEIIAICLFGFGWVIWRTGFYVALVGKCTLLGLTPDNKY